MNDKFIFKYKKRAINLARTVSNINEYILV